MTPGLNPSSVDDLNLAVRLYRRLMLRMVAIVLIGFAAAIMLSWVGTLISPPYGVYIYGESLAELTLMVMLFALVAEFYWEAWQISPVLHEPSLRFLPIPLLLTGMLTVSQRAHAMGMRRSGFLGLGPLRPVGGT